MFEKNRVGDNLSRPLIYCQYSHIATDCNFGIVFGRMKEGKLSLLWYTFILLNFNKYIRRKYANMLYCNPSNNIQQIQAIEPPACPPPYHLLGWHWSPILPHHLVMDLISCVRLLLQQITYLYILCINMLHIHNNYYPTMSFPPTGLPETAITFWWNKLISFVPRIGYEQNGLSLRAPSSPDMEKAFQSSAHWTGWDTRRPHPIEYHTARGK